MDRPRAVGRLEGAVEDVQVLGLEVRRALDRLVLVDEGDDLLGLVGGVAERLAARAARVWLTIFR